MKTRKPKLGGRYLAWVRGAFQRRPAKFEIKKPGQAMRVIQCPAPNA
jgi:hypothetical protein